MTYKEFALNLVLLGFSKTLGSESKTFTRWRKEELQLTISIFKDTVFITHSMRHIRNKKRSWDFDEALEVTKQRVKEYNDQSPSDRESQNTKTTNRNGQNHQNIKHVHQSI